MKKEKDDELDKLFRKGLENPVNEPAFREADWEAMEQMLDRPKKKPAILFWLPVLGSVAALLLLFLGYLILKSDIIKPGKNEQMVAAYRPKTNNGTPKKENTGTSGGLIRQAADSIKRKDMVADNANKPGKSQLGQKGKPFFTLSGGGRRSTTGPGASHLTAGTNTATIAQNKGAKKLQPDVIGNQPVIADNLATVRKNSGITDNPNNPGANDNHKDSVAINSLAYTEDNKKPGTMDDGKNLNIPNAQTGQKGSLADNTLPSAPTSAKVKGLKRAGRTVYAVTVLASSDLNGVNSSFQQTKVGGNFGALFSATFNKKWTISTGAQYDLKPYLVNFDNYHTTYQYKVDPSTINVNCKMLEIPVGINYKVYSILGNRITIGTGLSSYFMLREDYKFNYDESVSGPAGYSVTNKNRNILSVLNLDATYEHQINSKVGITLRPYLKVPLTNVGDGQVRLQSSGVALGLNWNLNTFAKPR